MGNGCATRPRSALATCTPKIEVTAEMVQARPDLKSYVGRKLTVIRLALGSHREKS